jgi:ABC-2 type transport system permease protein
LVDRAQEVLDLRFPCPDRSLKYGGDRTMSTISAPLTDSRIMLRRNFKHILRNPVTIFNGALMPVVIMLLFVYVLGNAFNVGEHYIEYATPGLLLLAISYGLSATAVSVNSDMTKGIINRFKVMNVSRGAVMTGHVAATMLGSSIAVAAIIGMAFALGFRSPATLLDWLGAIGIIVAAAFAAAWLTVALGMFARTPESAGLTVVPLILLPFVSSAIVPAGQMGQGVRQFAEYQPFTPIIESVRGLLAGTPSGGYAAAALAWCAGIAPSDTCGRVPRSASTDCAG